MMMHDNWMLLSSMLSLALITVGCGETETPDDADARHAAVDPADQETLTLELTLPKDVDPKSVEAIAKSAEQLAGESVDGAKVMAKADGKQMTLEIQLWGAKLDDEEDVIARLRAAHPVLNAQPVDVSREDGPPAGEPALELVHDPDATPAEIEAQVRAKLAEQGVEGDVKVEVGEDAEGHRRVEVRVEDHKTLEQ